MKKKKKKVNKKKLYSRIFLLLVIIILLVIVIKSFVKKDIPVLTSKVIISNSDVTADLSNAPYIDKDNILYISLEDVRKFFDKNVYYEESSQKIITTSGTKVAAIDVQNNILELNSATRILSVRSFKLWRYFFYSNFRNEKYI